MIDIFYSFCCFSLLVLLLLHIVGSFPTSTYRSNHDRISISSKSPSLLLSSSIIKSHSILTRLHSSTNSNNNNIPDPWTDMGTDIWGKRNLRYPSNNSTVGRVLNWHKDDVPKNLFDSVESIFGCNQKQNQSISIPFLDIESLGLRGQWIEDSGNYLLPPSKGEEVIGVIHFLGGAFVGAAPHITYRYLLEYLAEKGYLIVATPYRLGFDYITICDEILTKFDAVGVKLANMYGPLPVIGIGHSCGALLQAFITSLFPDVPRAVNILISFNNRPADSAIPLFEELIVPISEQIMDESDQSVNTREMFKIGRVLFDQAIDNYAKSSLAPKFVYNDILPFLKQSLEVVDQFPPLLQMIAKGSRDFEPNPKDTKDICRRMYRVRSTLLVKFENDDLDDSSIIEKVLQEANNLMKQKQPDREMEIEFKVVSGTHITPCTQNLIVDPPESIRGFIFDSEVGDPIRQQVRTEFLKTVRNLAEEVVGFLDKRIKL